MPKLIDRLQAGWVRLRGRRDAGRRELDLALLKATFADDGQPKRKHMDTLLKATNINQSLAQEYLAGKIVRALASEKNACVVAKLLVVLHRLLREGGDPFREVMYSKNLTGVFDNVRQFKDDSGGFALGLSVFIRAYATFLQHRIETYANFAYEKQPSRAQMLSLPAMLEELPYLEKAARLGAECGISPDLKVHSMETVQGFAQHMALGDTLLFIHHLLKAMPRLIDLFFSEVISTPARLGEARQMVMIYRQTQDVIGGLSDLDSSTFGHEWGSLSLTRPPDAMARAMQAKVEEMRLGYA